MEIRKRADIAAQRMCRGGESILMYHELITMSHFDRECSAEFVRTKRKSASHSFNPGNWWKSVICYLLLRKTLPRNVPWIAHRVSIDGKSSLFEVISLCCRQPANKRAWYGRQTSSTSHNAVGVRLQLARCVLNSLCVRSTCKPSKLISSSAFNLLSIHHPSKWHISSR